MEEGIVEALEPLPNSAVLIGLATAPIVDTTQRNWRKLDGSQHLQLVHEGRLFVDGLPQEQAVA